MTSARERYPTALEVDPPKSLEADRLGSTHSIASFLQRVGRSGQMRFGKHAEVRQGRVAASLAALSKLYDSRRGQGGQTVTVGKVNVEAGGQAIVGNVKTAARRTRRTGSESVPRKPTKKER